MSAFVFLRQEIEEMEIRFKQAELSRLTEQQEHEDELEKKRSQLDDLRAEAEAMKHQAEKVGQRIEMEVCLVSHLLRVYQSLVFFCITRVLLVYNEHLSCTHKIDIAKPFLVNMDSWRELNP